MVVIHSDGASEQAFAPQSSIESQALEEEMQTDFPIFGGNTWQDGIIPLSAELLWAFHSLIMVITHLQANASTDTGPPLPRWRFLLL